MPNFPSINQVVLYGVLKEIEHWTNVTFTCHFKIGISDGGKETLFECGTDESGEQLLRRARTNHDWVLVVGTVMASSGIFVVVREMNVTPQPEIPLEIRYVNLFGRITGVRLFEQTRQFDLEVYPQGGPTAKRQLNALLKCSVPNSDYFAETFRVTEIGDWVAVQGKIQSNGFVKASSFIPTKLDDFFSL